MRRPSAIVEHGEPSLIYDRCASSAAPIEILIVDNGNTHVYVLSDERALRLVAGLSNALARRQK